jgi:hypothetical protein
MHALTRDRKSKVVIPLPLEQQLGVGDLVEKVARALRIKKCESCEERRRRLNRVLAFGPRQR